MTFAMGRRFVIADGVERWKDAEIEPVVTAMAGVDARVADRRLLRARRTAQLKVPAGSSRRSRRPAARSPRRARSSRASCRAGSPSAPGSSGCRSTTRRARALVAQVGDRQQRLLRELEKLALEHGPGTSIGVEEVQESCAGSAERKLWTLADALVAGDGKGATRALLELREQGERLPGLLYGMVRRLRDALAIAEALAAGQPAAQIKRGLRMPGFAADRLIADAGRRDVESYRRGAGADGRPRAGEPRRRRGRARREHGRGPSGHRRGELSEARSSGDRRSELSHGSGPRGDRGGGLSGGRATPSGAGGRRGTSCAPRCSCAARRA